MYGNGGGGCAESGVVVMVGVDGMGDGDIYLIAVYRA